MKVCTMPHLLTQLLLPPQLVLAQLVRLPALHSAKHFSQWVPVSRCEDWFDVYTILSHDYVNMLWVEDLAEFLEERFMCWNITELRPLQARLQFLQFILDCSRHTGDLKPDCRLGK